MAWITPVTDRLPNSRTTAEDMNRIVGNIAHVGGTPVKASYLATDIVKRNEWDYIVQYAKSFIEEVTDATSYSNLNLIEAAIKLAHESLWLYPSETLYPSNDLIIHGEPEV